MRVVAVNGEIATIRGKENGNPYIHGSRAETKTFFGSKMSSSFVIYITAVQEKAFLSLARVKESLARPLPGQAPRFPSPLFASPAYLTNYQQHTSA